MAAGGEAIPNKDCLDCHSDKDLAKTNQTGRAISLYVDEAKLAASAHKTNWCSSCHSDLKRTHPDDNAPAQPAACGACHARQSESYGASAHRLAREKGEAGAATCRDCHGSHEVLPPSSPASPLHYSRLAATCGECHPDAARDVQESVHGRAAARGSREAAICTDCHAEHKIEGLKGASPVKLVEQICGKCHASERINSKYRMPANRVQTFLESYHGLAAHYGSSRAANCASCHGAHRILPSADPRSSIHKSHLVETCGKCHPGAGTNFALGTVHADAGADTDVGARVNRWVRRVYLGLIVVVVGLLGLHNLLAWWKHAQAARRAADRTVVRMPRSERLQHLLLLTSFVVLALSGFALKYPDSWLSILLGNQETLRRWIHRIAGVALLGLGAYHLAWVAGTTRGRQLVRDLWLRRQDARDVLANARHLAGRNRPRARFGRFGYPEKLEYWAVVWGTVIMGVTGLMIWFKIGVTQVLPRWIVEVAVTVHYYEAVLACLAIVVWHFYAVIFSPEVYPLNWAWWDGRVSARQHAEEHPLAADAPEGPTAADPKD